ncbi:uncharacterized protein [Asterias amurensis]|uniref:uncharacterized protein isoform X1 n=2 Tax=Asterias amurensis TaxID=7602 RepID=UPI003AB27D68
MSQFWLHISSLQLRMTTVTMTTVLLLISTLTTGIPVNTHPVSSAGLDKTLFQTASTLSQTDKPVDRQTTRGEELTSSGGALSQIMEKINGNTQSTKTEKLQTATSEVTEGENEVVDIPHRIRRSARCQRKTDEELTSLLQSLGGVNTRYLDQTKHGFTSLVPFSTNSEIERLSKLEIETALRSNNSEVNTRWQPHLQVIRSSLVTPEKVNVQRVRRTVIGTTVSDFCVTSGQETTRGYMRTCDTCAATTELSDDYFPRYLNEAVCSSTTECLSGGGKCVERMLNLSILHRTGTCTVVAATTGSEAYYVEDWESSTHRARVACECDIDVQSVFAQYV